MLGGASSARARVAGTANRISNNAITTLTIPHCSVIRAMKQRVGEAGVVAQPGLGEQCFHRKRRADQALALQRHPNGGITEAGGVACSERSVAQMEMIAVRRRQIADADRARLLTGAGMV